MSEKDPYPHWDYVTDQGLAWLGQEITLQAGQFRYLPERLPVFERVPAIWDHCENTGADFILSMKPGESKKKTPVALVSKFYELLQHHELTKAIEKVLSKMELNVGYLPVRLGMTSLGERLHLAICLPGWAAHNWSVETLDLELHVFNSVDKSIALRLHLGWYSPKWDVRWFLNAEVGRFRRPHSVMQRELHLEEEIAGLFSRAKNEYATVREWMTTPVRESVLEEWTDETLVGKWGVQMAVRFFHIATEGWDGWVIIDSHKKVPAHERDFKRQSQVLSVETPVRCALDIVLLLAWMADQDPRFEQRYERLHQIPDLMKSFVSKVRGREVPL